VKCIAGPDPHRFVPEEVRKNTSRRTREEQRAGRWLRDMKPAGPPSLPQSK